MIYHLHFYLTIPNSTTTIVITITTTTITTIFYSRFKLIRSLIIILFRIYFPR